MINKVIDYLNSQPYKPWFRGRQVHSFTILNGKVSFADRVYEPMSFGEDSYTDYAYHTNVSIETKPVVVAELLLDKTSFEKEMMEVSMWIMKMINENYPKNEEKEMNSEKEYIESTVNENLPADITFRTDDGRDATLVSVRVHEYNHHIFILKGVVNNEVVSKVVFVRLNVQDCTCSFQEAHEECPEIVMAPKHITDYINDIFAGTKHNNPAPITNEEPGSYNVSSTEVSFPSAADVEYQVITKAKERVVKAIWTAVEKEKLSCQVFIDKAFFAFIKYELIELGYTVLDEQGANGDDVLLTIIWSNYNE